VEEWEPQTGEEWHCRCVKATGIGSDSIERIELPSDIRISHASTVTC
jgi:hypothetical protein